MLRAVRLKQNQDYSLGAMMVDSARKLEPEERSVLDDLIDDPLLLTPLNETEEATGEAGTDGARWIFETCLNKKFQKLDFWCLKHFGPSRYKDLGIGIDYSKIRDTQKLLKLASKLLELSKIKTPDNELY